MRRNLAFLVIISALFVNCAGDKINDSDPAALYKEAEEDIKSDHFQLALDKLRMVKNKFPYSKYSADAQLRMADVYFLQESYSEAAITYESFRDLHPKNEKVPYAMFRVGKSYLSDMPSNVARDQSSGQKALDAFAEFLRRYPNVPEAIEAKKDTSDIRQKLAEKELYIANFYFKRSIDDSAKTRFEKLIAAFPETDSAKEAREKLDRIQKLKPGN